MKRIIALALATMSIIVLAATSYTTNYDLAKPADGDSNWGDSYRSNMDTIDSQMFINSNATANHIADTTGAHAATAISTTVGTLCSTTLTVQDYLDCLDGQVNAITAGTVVTTDTAQTISGLKTFSTTPRFTALGLGLLHVSGDGTLTSSLVINDDVDPAAGILGTKISPDFGSQNVVSTGTASFGSTTVTGLSVGSLTGVVKASTGTISASTLVNADVSASAAIEGTKISPDFGSQNVTTTGLFLAANGTAAAPSIALTNSTGTGFYRVGTDSLGIATGGTLRGGFNSSGNFYIGTGSTSINFLNNKNITGSATSYGNYLNSTIQSDVTTAAYGHRTELGTAAASFTVPTLRHYFASQGTIGATSTVTNQGGFWASSGLIGATENYGFRGDLSSNAARWNLYMAGTAQNYILGNVGIGSGKTAPAVALDVAGVINTDTSLTLQDPGAGTNKITIQAPTLAGNYTLTLPVDDGTLNQVLATNGSGTLSWANSLSNPMDSEGDLIVGGASGAATKLDSGTTGQVLTSAGAASPTWSFGDVVTITSASSPYTLTTTTKKLIVNASGGAITINLPAASNSGYSAEIIITSGTNLVTLDPNSTETICGQSTIVMSGAGDRLNVISDGTNYTSTGCIRQFTAQLRCFSSSAISSDPFAAISSIGNISTGACTVTTKTGIFSSTPICSAAYVGASPNGIFSVTTNVSSSTSTTIKSRTDNGSISDATDYTSAFICQGSR